MRSLWAGDALGSLDRTPIHPGVGGGVPDAEGVIRLHDVGIALGRTSGQLSLGGHLPLEGDAQARSTLYALLALGAPLGAQAVSLDEACGRFASKLSAAQAAGEL